MQAVAFGYKCQECGRGTVNERFIPEYHTKIKGYPFVVRGARIGMCNECGAEHFAAQETECWERTFEEEHGRHFLAPEEIQELQRSLGLTMEQFAFLIGCTRQSLYNWKRPDRNRPQSRMANLLMKLVRESRESGKVDVLRFLVQDAKQFGIHLGRMTDPSVRKPIIFPVKKMPITALRARLPELAQMAADTEENREQVVALSLETDEPVGRLSYDFQTASLELELIEPLDIGLCTVEVHFVDGAAEKSDAVAMEKHRVTLLARTSRTEYEVTEIVLLPGGTKAEASGKSK